VTVFGWEDHLGISPSHLGQLHLLSYMGWEISSTDQSAVMLCGWEVRAGWLIPLVDKSVCVAGKTVRYLVSTCQYLSTLEMSIIYII